MGCGTRTAGAGFEYRRYRYYATPLRVQTDAINVGPSRVFHLFGFVAFCFCVLTVLAVEQPRPETGRRARDAGSRPLPSSLRPRRPPFAIPSPGKPPDPAPRCRWSATRHGEGRVRRPGTRATDGVDGQGDSSSFHGAPIGLGIQVPERPSARRAHAVRDPLP